MKVFYRVTALFFVLVVFLGMWTVLFSNVKEDTVIYIPTDAKYDDLKEILYPYLKNEKTFEFVSKLKKFKKLKAGRYYIEKSWGNNKLINSLRKGGDEINVTFNDQETIYDLAGVVSRQIEADSVSIIRSILDEDFLKENNLTSNSVTTIFIPNTYQFYWNTNASKFLERMIIENQKFWDEKKMAKLESIGLTKEEVVTLASIVHKETYKSEEKPIIAGLYLNRLKKNMRLQSDPTVIYALKEQKEFKGEEIKRVLYKDLKIDSPYNTYLNLGLPPSPICIPDISSIEAVLNYKKHNYIYMCASVERIGYHDFSNSIEQHNINKNKYVGWLKTNNIKR